MKIRVTFTVEVDPDQWALEFGTDPKSIRDDVKGYCENAAKQQLARIDVYQPEPEYQ